MNLNEYQAEATRTAIMGLSLREERVYTALGLAGEVGEYVDRQKKELFHGWTGDGNAKEELGDILWYVSQAAWAHGFSLEEVALNNVNKLRTRYPEGFDRDRSQARQTKSKVICNCEVAETTPNYSDEMEIGSHGGKCPARFKLTAEDIARGDYPGGPNER